MHRTQLENIIESYDKEGFSINQAIEKDNANKLRILVEETSKEDAFKWINKATEHKSWNCLIYLLEKMDSINNCNWYHFSQATLIASIDNNQPFLDAILSHSSSDLCSRMFYEEGFFTDTPRRDSNNGYTALHWAVINDNTTLFEKHTISRYYNHDDALYLTDNSNRTALDLAIMLNKVHCAEVLAKHMHLKNLVFCMTPLTFKTIIQDDLRLNNKSWDRGDSPDKVKTRLIELIDELDDPNKEKALNQALEPTSMLGNLLLKKDKYLETDHEMRLLLAKKLLELMNKKEQERKKKKEKESSSTAVIRRSLYAEPNNANIDISHPFLEPVYISQKQIPEYLNTKQFQAIFQSLPYVSSNNEAKQPSKVSLLG